MKKVLILIILLFNLKGFGQKKSNAIYKETFIDSLYKDSINNKESFKWYTNNKNTSLFQYNNGNNKLLYKIKADGSIEFGDLIIEAVIKGLEEKGYTLIKVGGSVTSNFTKN